MSFLYTSQEIPQKWAITDQISLISNFAKIKKKQYTVDYDFINKHKILVAQQFVFKKGKGCDNALPHSIDFIYNKVDKSLPVIATFLDLSKVFDTVDNDILSIK